MFDNKGNDNLNAARILGTAAINKANSGHPGIVLGAAPAMFSLYANVMNIDPSDPIWFNRDRFVLSAGHGSALLYSMLHLVGFDYSIDDLKAFRQPNGITPGHPEIDPKLGIEVTTGPLGQGIGMAVGLALAESFLAAKFNKPDAKIVDHYTYVICGDGDLQEGVSYETISFAGKNKLNKLIILHDSNDVQLDDYVKFAQTENMKMRFESAGWNTLKVEDGEDTEDITKAIEKAKQSDRPTYIEIKTVIGNGSSLEGTLNVHGAPIGDDIENVKKNFGWNHGDFEVPKEVYEFFKNNTLKRGQKANENWRNTMHLYAKKYPNDYQNLMNAIDQNYDIDWTNIENKLKTEIKPEATRVSSGAIFNEIAKQIPTMIGGSADLASSTKIAGPDGKYSNENPAGRNIMYGVREFGMGAINNGLAAHGGILPFASGFFVFSDYMKPALRMSAMMKAHQLYIYTHDSVAVGEDGPTHQPIEQLAMIRSIPNQILFRPADFAETYGVYKWALDNVNTNGPITIVATRQNVDQLKHLDDVVDSVAKGAYILSDSNNAKVTLIATGSEVGLAMKTKGILEAKNIPTRVVSMPSQEIFDRQSINYKNSVIDRTTFRASIEMGSTYGWAKYTGDNGINFGIDTFGQSGPGNIVVENYGFSAEKIAEKILKAVK